MGDGHNTRKGHLSRRTALGLGLVIVAGCAADAETKNPPVDPLAPPPGPAGTTTPPPPDVPPNVVPPQVAKDLLAGIDHIVVLMMENRSFDHMLGALKMDAGYPSRAVVEGLSGTESNLAVDGTTVTVHRLDNFTVMDPDHSWPSCHNQFNGGLNDGFVTEHAGPFETEVMGYHDRTQIPFYYWLADNFAICDHWFASVMGPTWPNRFYLHSTTSFGKKDNTPFLSDAPDTIWDRLRDLKLDAKNYAAGALPWYLGGYAGKVASNDNPTAPIADFFAAAQGGTLPPFCLVDPDFDASDDHPAHDIHRGQAFVASVYKALAESPAWFRTLLIVTYDEHGGFYDHVPPPVAPDDDPEFAQFGFRVPAFVIGPTVKKGYVCKTQLDHASVAATLRTRFALPHLTTRMDKANDIADCIDPAKVAKPAIPPQGMPVIAMTREAALQSRVGTSSQPMLGEMVAKGLARPLDARPHEQRIAAWLAHATRLGAVRIIG